MPIQVSGFKSSKLSSWGEGVGFTGLGSFNKLLSGGDDYSVV